MEELKEKANIYAEENAINVLKEAFAKVYADGYKDRAEEVPIDFCDSKTEFVDLGLPSGTLWSNNCISDIDLSKNKQSCLPSEDQCRELIEHCTFVNYYRTSSNRGYVCVGLNGNTIRFQFVGWYPCRMYKEYKNNDQVLIRVANESDSIKVIVLSEKGLVDTLYFAKDLNGAWLPIRLVQAR